MVREKERGALGGGDIQHTYKYLNINALPENGKLLAIPVFLMRQNNHWCPLDGRSRARG